MRLPLSRPLVALAAFALALQGCGEEAVTLPASAPGPALWAVTAPDGTVKGWLFGTVHALPDGTRWRSKALDAALAQADMLVVEVADLANPETAQSVFAATAFDRADGPLLARVDAARRPVLERLIAQHRVDRAALDRMESWAAALTLAQSAQQGRSENGADRALLASFSGREVIELEGAAAQLALFDTLPPAEQRDLLAAVIDESTNYAQDSAAMIEQWHRGDLEALAGMTRRGILADPELHRALLTTRNEAWLVQIENLLSSDARPFVAVGAGHMLGPQGLPALLGRHGHTVRRIQ